jgi:hypothetical protein
VSNLSKTISKVKEKNLKEGSDMYLVWAWLESKPLEERKMTYLIRRMNKKGYWMTIGSLDYIPRQWFGWEQYLKLNYGPGRYSIGRVEQGLQGMTFVGTFIIGYDHEYVCWVPEKPTVEYLQSHGITGDLIIAQLCNTTHFRQLRNDSLLDQQVYDQLEQGIQGFKSGWVIIRVKGLPY